MENLQKNYLSVCVCVCVCVCVVCVCVCVCYMCEPFPRTQYINTLLTQALQHQRQQQHRKMEAYRSG